MKKIKLNYFLLYFLLFSLGVICVYLYYTPSWGLMDDCYHLEGAKKIWSSPEVVRAFCKEVKEDFISQKIRPLHCLYVAFVYKFFAHNPLLVYILIFIVSMAILPLWGVVFHRMFSKQDRILPETLFIYPLCFFIYTPFWNNFMYISIQERHIFFFCTLSMYFFIRAYDKGRYRDLSVSFIFNLLCILSKPTGVFITLAFVMFSLLDIIIFRRNTRTSSICLAFNFSFLFFYYLFMKVAVIIPGYSLKYIQSLNIIGIVNNITKVSIVIKGILIFAAVSFSFFIYEIKKRKFNIVSMLLPLGLMSYILILAPWGINNYHLGTAAPFIMGMFFPIYCGMRTIFYRARLQYLPCIIIILLSLAVLEQIIIPRISEIADIRKVENSIVDLRNNTPEVKFFFPPPYMESCDVMCRRTGADIMYLSDRILAAEMLVKGGNYLIYGFECADIELENVVIKDMVYQNNTWKIFELKEAEGKKETIHVNFRQSLLQNLVVFIRDRK